MPKLHPQIEKVLETMAQLDLKPIEAMTPVEARVQMEAMAASRKAETLPVARVEDRTIPGPDWENPAAHLLAEHRRYPPGDCLLSWRRPCHRQPRQP